MEREINFTSVACVCGPSGSGKNTLTEGVSGLAPRDFVPMKQVTTRPIRDSERPGREYFFVTGETYNRLRPALTAKTEIAGNRYGTLAAFQKGAVNTVIADSNGRADLMAGNVFSASVLFHASVGVEPMAELSGERIAGRNERDESAFRKVLRECDCSFPNPPCCDGEWPRVAGERFTSFGETVRSALRLNFRYLLWTARPKILVETYKGICKLEEDLDLWSGACLVERLDPGALSGKELEAVRDFVPMLHEWPSFSPEWGSLLDFLSDSEDMIRASLGVSAFDVRDCLVSVTGDLDRDGSGATELPGLGGDVFWREPRASGSRQIPLGGAGNCPFLPIGFTAEGRMLALVRPGTAACLFDAVCS